MELAVVLVEIKEEHVRLVAVPAVLALQKTLFSQLLPVSVPSLAWQIFGFKEQK